MQTREPRKRVNWLFVFLLIIVIPLALLILFMMNSMPDETKPTISNQETPAKITVPDTNSTRAPEGSEAGDN